MSRVNRNASTVRRLVLAACTAFVAMTAAPAQASIIGGIGSGFTSALDTATPYLNLFGIDYVWADDPVNNGQYISFNGTYNNRNFDVGFADLTLDGSFRNSFGYGLRGIPNAQWNMQTNNLTYVLQTKNGIDDFIAQGQLSMQSQGDVTALGFYSVSLNLSNRGNVSLRGATQDAEESTDFNLGPINIRGNFFVDAFTGLAGALGLDTSGINSVLNETAVTGKAITVARDAQQKMERGEELTAEELQTLVSLDAAGNVLGMDLMPFFSDNDLSDALEFAAAEGFAESDGTNYNGNLAAIPEPATLTLLAAGGLLLARRRRSSN